MKNLGLYIHIPFCVKKCPYCAFYSVPIDSANPNKLIDAVFGELDRIAPTEQVETIYIGGGSPSCLSRELLIETIVSLTSQFQNVSEFTLECNPAQADPGMLKLIRTLGVNRLSIGAQSFHEDDLKTLGRIHNPDQIITAVENAQQAGFENISLDLMFAVPNSNIDNWKYSLQCAIELDVQHISAYSLTIENQTPFDRAVRDGKLITLDEATDRTMHNTARQMLTDAGFAQYEISNFAKPGYECQHNIRYWKNQPTLGLGPAAASWYHQTRTTNIADVDAYISAMENKQTTIAETHIPDLEQIASETAVLMLRMTEGINLKDYAKQTGFELFQLFADAVAAHTASGLLECTSDDHVRLTEKGLNYADTVAQDFIL